MCRKQQVKSIMQVDDCIDCIEREKYNQIVLNKISDVKTSL